MYKDNSQLRIEDFVFLAVCGTIREQQPLRVVLVLFCLAAFLQVAERAPIAVL